MLRAIKNYHDHILLRRDSHADPESVECKPLPFSYHASPAIQKMCIFKVVRIFSLSNLESHNFISC